MSKKSRITIGILLDADNFVICGIYSKDEENFSG